MDGDRVVHRPVRPIEHFDNTDARQPYPPWNDIRGPMQRRGATMLQYDEHMLEAAALQQQPMAIRELRQWQIMADQERQEVGVRQRQAAAKRQREAAVEARQRQTIVDLQRQEIAAMNQETVNAGSNTSVKLEHAEADLTTAVKNLTESTTALHAKIDALHAELHEARRETQEGTEDVRGQVMRLASDSDGLKAMVEDLGEKVDEL